MADAVDVLAHANRDKSHGSIYTKQEVVDFILDLLGYKSTQPLFKKRILEPSFGGGDFVLPIIDRLIESIHEYKVEPSFENLSHCIRAVELHEKTFRQTHQKVFDRLKTTFPKSLPKGLLINGL